MSQPPYPPPGPPSYQQWPAPPPPAPPAWGHPGAPAPSQQQWRPEMAAHPHAEPRPYPLMLRTWDYRWWKPLIGILIVGVGGMLAVPLLLLPILVVGVALEGGHGDFATRFTNAAAMKSVTPSTMLYLNLTLACLTLLAMGTVRFVHRLRPRWLASVMPGIRWKFFFACLGLAVIALVAQLAVSYALPDSSSELSGTPHLPTGQLLVTAVVILVTTPLQALGEEYGFRGYLLQAFGSFFDGVADSLGLSRRVAAVVASVLALLLTSGLFALAHGAQNFPLFFDRFAFGLMAGTLVILVGGLEAGIALHILNNLLAFGAAILLDQLDGVLTVSEASWWQLPVTVTEYGVYLVLVLLVARAMRLRNRTAPEAATLPAQ